MKVLVLLCMVALGLVMVGECGPSTTHFLRRFRDTLRRHQGEHVFKHDDDNLVQGMYKQQKDHFDALDTTLFEQRYFYNDAYYKPGGPVFFQLGQEGPSNIRDVDGGLAVALAPQFGALVVELEHRYYGPGESCPVDNLETHNMKWLSSMQALEDFADFRVDFHNIVNIDGMDGTEPWVIFGCSYAGAMTSWLRMRYPHLFITGIGGSGPVEAQVDFFEYDEVVSYSLTQNSQECWKNSQSAMQTAGDMASDPSNWDELAQMFNTCTPITDAPTFIDTIYNPIAFSVQYNEASLDFPRDSFCETMKNSSNTPLQNLADANANPKFGNPPGCLVIDIYNGPDGLLNTSTSVEFRKWMWQTCSEFGYYQTAGHNGKNTLSPIVNVSFFIDMCATTFNGAFDEDIINTAIQHTNDRYGAKHPDSTNVMFPNGFEDPWSSLGIKRMVKPTEMPALWREQGHCAPWSTPADNEPPSVKESRGIILTWLRYLLPEYVDDTHPWP